MEKILVYGILLIAIIVLALLIYGFIRGGSFQILDLIKGLIGG
jgi:t-SNARE complex subunit (syntaxin)